VPRLDRLATTIETWWPHILAFLTTGITNAGFEGTNRVIKPSAVTRTAFAIPKISGYIPAPRPPDATADTSTPLNFEEPWPAPCADRNFRKTKVVVLKTAGRPGEITPNQRIVNPRAAGRHHARRLCEQAPGRTSTTGGYSRPASPWCPARCRTRPAGFP
jgi:hypothetical protein